MQVVHVQQAPFLSAVQKIRMASASVAEAKLVSDALVRILLPKAPGTEYTVKGMLGYVYSLEDCSTASRSSLAWGVIMVQGLFFWFVCRRLWVRCHLPLSWWDPNSLDTQKKAACPEVAPISRYLIIKNVNATKTKLGQ